MATERLAAIGQGEVAFGGAAKQPLWCATPDLLAPSASFAQTCGGTCACADLLDSIFALVTHVLGVRRCSIMLLDGEERLVVHKSYGLGRDIVAQTRLAIGERIAGKVAATRQPILFVGEAGKNEAEARGYRTSSFVSVPIVSSQKLHGVLNAADKADGSSFDHSDLATLIMLAQHVALCIENADLQREIARLANTDDLTGLYNHRYFQKRLEEEVERARRFGRQIALLMTDLDSFKEFNDTHGHPTGDLALRWVAGVVTGAVRQSDVVCRYGGDEFAIIAPETGEEDAYALAGRLSEAIAGAQFQEASRIQLGLSIGVAAYPRGATSNTELIEQADRAMYAAKQERR